MRLKTLSDARTPGARAYRALYRTTLWRTLRDMQLCEQPRCERCLALGKLTPATVVNHRAPHKGDAQLFHDPENLQSLCKPCHDGPTQQRERIGYEKTIGVDGWPIDPLHPFNELNEP
jgi:5-methylcytosine-specific restriction protein A